MTNRTLILIFIALVLGLASYVIWRRGNLPAEGLPAQQGSAESVTPATAIAALQRLRTVQLDTSILRSPLWRALKELPPNPTPLTAPGRANPFILDSDGT